MGHIPLPHSLPGGYPRSNHHLTSHMHHARQVWRGALLLCDWVLHAAAGEERGSWSAERGCCPPTGVNPMDGSVILELGAGKARDAACVYGYTATL